MAANRSARDPSKGVPAPYGLALHTTTGQLGLSISNFAGERRSHSWDLGRDISTYLQLYLSEFLAPQTWPELAWIAVAKGPGGFTGTRIGVVTARTVAQQLDLPVFAISTLAAIAWSAHHTLPPGEAIAVQMKARRGQYFGGIYRVAPIPAQENRLPLQMMVPDAAFTPETWQHQLTTLNGPYQLLAAPNRLGDSVDSILDLAHQQWQQGQRPHWSEALPFYGQHPVRAVNAVSP